MRKYATYEIIHVNCDYSEKPWSVCSSPYGFFSDTWGFPTWSTDTLFLFPSCQKHLDYVRILRRNNWIVRSQKFRISDGWVQNLTTVPGIGQKCTKIVVSKIRQTGPNSDTSIWFSTPLFNIRTLSSHFE